MKSLIEEPDENNNENKSIIDAFDSEPGYYSQVIRSMLRPGHETELTYWCRSLELIPSIQTCKNANSNNKCNFYMEWTPAVRYGDSFQWKCRNCTETKSVREKSVFQDVKCSLKHCLRILLGWCKQHDVETMANIIGIKKHNVRALYGAVTAIAKKYLKNKAPNRRLGGPGVVVVVDTYPEGCTNNTRPVRGNRSILCIAEAKSIPPNYWFEPLDRYSRNNTDQLNSVKTKTLEIIQDIVLPGSIIVARQESTLCSYFDLLPLNNMYPTIVSVEGLARHNTENQDIFANLEIIWKLALDVCEQAQFFSYDEVPNFLIAHMWSMRFGNEAFEMLLNCLTDLQ